MYLNLISFTLHLRLSMGQFGHGLELSIPNLKIEGPYWVLSDPKPKFKVLMLYLISWEFGPGPGPGPGPSWA